MDTAKLEKLLDTGQLLAEQHKLEDLLQRAIQVALAFIPAEYGYIILQGENDKIKFYVGLDKDGNTLGEPLERISKTIYKQVLSTRDPALIAGKVRSLDTQKSTKELQIRSLICVPLLSSGKVLGALYVENRSAINIFKEEDLILINYFASMVATGIENANLNEDLEARIKVRTAELEGLAACLQTEIEERRITEDALNERVKELKCIYELTLLVETPNISLNEILQGSVERIAAAMRYPQLVWVRLVLKDRTFVTKNYQDSNSKLSHNIAISGQKIGVLEVGYPEQKKETKSFLFLEEEKNLLRIMAVRLANVIQYVQAEEALQQSEEKFSKAFYSSPDAILISRLDTGELVEVNEGFCRTTGYSRQEAFSDSSISQRLWANPKDREEMIANLQKNKRIIECEYTFRTKSGRLVTGIYSGEIIFLENKAHILSIVRDISEQKQATELNRFRLELWEYTASNSLEDLMQKALDEICAITGSPIGFYHFVNENEQTLSLQAWSTRTLEEFCQAKGRGLHYDIDQAGVWVDAFRQREPVIHNDYAALPHRKGMPEGHAEIIRQLVVPVLRDGRVVSILGVGNKPSNYDENDIELVTNIADLIWTIVDHKRREEQIRLLNSKLEYLAMTDELTGIINRRSFFKRGSEEFQRFLRYQTPFSLLALDIDNFKRVNDTYGHATGDQVLKHFTQTLQDNIRSSDIFARLGGEEFAIILPNTRTAKAHLTAEKLRLAVEKQHCTTKERQEINITVSIGIAESVKDSGNFEAILKNADAALYRAKSLGRNRSCLGKKRKPKDN